MIVVEYLVAKLPEMVPVDIIIVKTVLNVLLRICYRI